MLDGDDTRLVPVRVAWLPEERGGRRAARLNDVLPWYLHDALIHYTTPHGLEQYSGAAWGLRDVCQGPVELLVATGNLVPLRALLKIVYEHQFRQTGEPARLRLALDIAQAPARQIVYIDNTPMFVQIAEGLGIRSILHTDYGSTRAKLASFGLQSDG